MSRVLLVFLAVIPIGLFSSPFQAVFINQDDVAQFGGSFPIPRRHLASAILAAQRAGAKAVVLKLFIDLPAKNAEDDLALANAIKNAALPVILQANLDPTAEDSTPLSDRFIRKDIPRLDGVISGDRGWLPLATFAEGAHAIGFIDALNPVPLVESYQGRSVPSLFLVTLELVLGKASFEPNSVALGAKTLSLKKGSVEISYPKADDLKPFSLADLIAGKLDQRIRGQVVIIGYDGDHMHTFPTPIGPVKAHRLFFYELELAYAAFAEKTHP